MQWSCIVLSHWNGCQCSCTVSKFCTGTVFNVLAQHQSFTPEQCSMFLHSINVLHWNIFQCSCTVSKFHTGRVFQCSCTVSMFTRTVFFLIIPKCSVLVSLEQCTNGTAFHCLFKIHECMALMFCTGTVFNHYLSTLRKGLKLVTVYNQIVHRCVSI